MVGIDQPGRFCQLGCSMAFAPTAASVPCSYKQTAPQLLSRSSQAGSRVSLPRSPTSRRRNVHAAPLAVAATKSAVTEKKLGAKSAEMTSEEAADLYRDMMLGRDFEDMCAQMYYRGKMFGK